MALSLHTHDLPRGLRSTCIACRLERRDLLECVGYAVAALTMLVLLFLLTSCGCATAYRYNGGPLGSRAYYKVQLCSDKPPRVLCDSPDPLPNADCE